MSYNVNRNVSDTFYRYKMPRLLAKVEGKGNGIKTVMVNMVDVAKALGRPPTYPTKFFGCELGAQTQFDFKNDRYIVNGSHESNKLQSLLDGFIKKYVLCPECDNPETNLFPNEKKGIIKQTCKACGYQGLVDMRHKLTTFILKNPPDVKPDQQGTSLTKKKNRRSEKNGKSGSSPSRGSDNSDDLNGEDDDDDWAVDVSEEAVERRMKDLTSGVKNLTVSNDSEKSLSERLEIFFGYCKTKKDAGILKPGADLAVWKDIAGEAERLEIKESKGIMVLVELLLGENVVKEIPQYRVLFLHFTYKNVKSQKYLLGAIEKLIELNKDLLAKVPIIFKALYDSDIVEEEVFMEWGKKASKKYVAKETSVAIQAKAEKFLKWLKEADEESSEEETEDDDVEIEYDDKARSESLRAQEVKA
ncbi:UNVERIFIED_CONTAM: hypothetical protein GTU68_041887, partial [Idotea baltica]|nr:hypothetical protein [Idotea baltica]MCL4122339.1 hypothetical protein [Idotea baltica]